jgi:hypothetical protein
VDVVRPYLSREASGFSFGSSETPSRLGFFRLPKGACGVGAFSRDSAELHRGIGRTLPSANFIAANLQPFGGTKATHRMQTLLPANFHLYHKTLIQKIWSKLSGEKPGKVPRRLLH